MDPAVERQVRLLVATAFRPIGAFHLPAASAADLAYPSCPGCHAKGGGISCSEEAAGRSPWGRQRRRMVDGWALLARHLVEWSSRAVYGYAISCSYAGLHRRGGRVAHGGRG